MAPINGIVRLANASRWVLKWIFMLEWNKNENHNTNVVTPCQYIGHRLWFYHPWWQKWLLFPYKNSVRDMFSMLSIKPSWYRWVKLMKVYYFINGTTYISPHDHLTLSHHLDQCTTQCSPAARVSLWGRMCSVGIQNSAKWECSEGGSS